MSEPSVSIQVLKNSTEMYSEKDLYVGKVLSVHQRTFELLEADEFTYQYMENNRHVYLMADWEAGLKAIQAQLQGRQPTAAHLGQYLQQYLELQVDGSSASAALLRTGWIWLLTATSRHSPLKHSVHASAQWGGNSVVHSLGLRHVCAEGT